MKIVGPSLSAEAECEDILRSLPLWFGIEESLLMYAKDSGELPTFAVTEAGRIVGFLSLRQHFPTAWEIHCVAIHAQSRNQGYGKALLAHAERWLFEQGVSLLQVKTIAATSACASYAKTRKFYLRLGFLPLEVFPHLWSPSNPCLQLVKLLREDA
jgi:GNAT superfamily N-acetyltransferase